MKTAPRAVIFDLDGVLVDSSYFHFEAWKAWAQQVGAQQPVTETWFRQTFGLRNDAIIPTLIQRPLTPEETDALSDQKEAIFRQLAHGHLQPLPGVRELVEGLHQADFRLAVGTSTPPENLEMVLEDLSLARYFPVRITSTDVQQGKPDPEVFLRAAGRLQVAPERCVVIEDAKAGVEAARRGGMFAIAVTTTHPSSSFQQAHWIVDSLTEVNSEDIEHLLETGKAKKKKTG